MARPKLTNDQRAQVLAWIAADYSGDLILHWIRVRREMVPYVDGKPVPELRNPEQWPEITKQDISYYRGKYGTAIDELRATRHSAALTTGLALKEERIQRLKEHADRLEAIKWDPDDKGRLWNEKAWREVLDDIAKELGHRRQYTGGVNVTITPEELEQLSDDDLERLKQQIA